jgi:vacuolar-type H+-ATPase subunit I/STV1
MQQDQVFWSWLPSAIAALVPVAAVVIAYLSLRNTQKQNSENRRLDTLKAKDEILGKIQRENETLLERLQKVERLLDRVDDLKDDVEENAARLRDVELATAVMKALQARQTNGSDR